VDESPSSPILTVAVPTCNGADHLAEALGSILSQEGVAFELLVSDDRSDDQTLAVVRAVAGDRARIAVNSVRLGLAGNWNRCAAICRTPLIAIFHQDDVMEPGHLAAHAAALTSNESIGLVASGSTVIDERGQPVPADLVERGGLGPVDRVYDPGTLAPTMVAGNPLRCSAVTLRRTAFQDAGGFDPSYRYVVDWDCWLRLSRHWRVAWLARPSVRVRWHLASETHQFKAGTADLEETARLMEVLFATDLKEHPDVPRFRKKARARLARAFLNRAHEALRAGRTDLARDALRRGVRLAPGLVATILRSPRLAVTMATLAAAPRLAGRLFARGKRSG
jgi:hypothetical protein